MSKQVRIAGGQSGVWRCEMRECNPWWEIAEEQELVRLVPEGFRVAVRAGKPHFTVPATRSDGFAAVAFYWWEEQAY